MNVCKNVRSIVKDAKFYKFVHVYLHSTSKDLSLLVWKVNHWLRSRTLELKYWLWRVQFKRDGVFGGGSGKILDKLRS